MRSPDTLNNILVIQTRGIPETVAHEKQLFDRHAAGSGKNLTYLNVTDEVMPFSLDKPGQILSHFGGGIIVGGSGELFHSRPDAVTDMVFNRLKPLGDKVIDTGEKSLWICYGHQTLGLIAGAEVGEVHEEKEAHTAMIDIDPDIEHVLLQGRTERIVRAISTHEDSLLDIPEGFTHIGSTLNEQGEVHHRAAGMAIGDTLATQWHPEYDDQDVLERWHMTMRAKNDGRIDISDNAYANPVFTPVSADADLPLRNMFHGPQDSRVVIPLFTAA